MKFPRVMAAAAAALFVACAAPAAAQVRPGVHVDFGKEHQEWRSAVLHDASQTLTEWSASWTRRDPRMIARFYTLDATLVLPDQDVIQGRDAIQKALGELLTSTGEFRVSLTDADAGEPLAYVMGRFLSMPKGADATANPQTGTYIAVLKHDGRIWRIRSQLFRPDPAPTPAN